MAVNCKTVKSLELLLQKANPKDNVLDCNDQKLSLQSDRFGFN